MERLTVAPPGFRSVPRTGVIYVMTEAAKQGYKAGGTEWANLGQGSPETGSLPGSPARIDSVSFTAEDCEYSPIDGLPALREAVAQLYNQRYRRGMKSQYAAENVAISPGGRSALTRMVSTLGRTNVGHFLPDYTAYEELLDSFGTFVPIPIIRKADEHYNFTAKDLSSEILGRGLSAVVMSNPNNPTGTLVHGDELGKWVDVARDLRCTLIIDEFYSHYIYLDNPEPVSAARYVEDVNKDPIILIDGLTKNWRYPGFRVSWTVGPKSVIEGVTSAGSFLEGGCARPMQIAAIPLAQKEIADREADAIQSVFHTKRDVMLSGLEKLGITVDPIPFGAFYAWGNLQNLAPSINSGMNFFRKALEHKVIVVPGAFFDINPGHRRPDRPSRFQQYARFSFGPALTDIERGLKSLEKMIAAER